MTHDTVRDYRKFMKIALFVYAHLLFGGGCRRTASRWLALFSDAGHRFSDLLPLLLSLGTMTLALQLPTKERTVWLPPWGDLRSVHQLPAVDRGACRYPDKRIQPNPELRV